MKAIVLCGGIPQIELLNQLKERNIETILLDMNEKVKARQHKEAAKIIKTIFKKAAEGHNTKGIVEYLNKRKMPTPAEYFRQQEGILLKRLFTEYISTRWIE